MQQAFIDILGKMAGAGSTSFPGRTTNPYNTGLSPDAQTEAGFCPTCGAGASGRSSGLNTQAADILNAATAGSKDALPYAQAIQDKVRVGYRAGRNRCWRAVWNVLKAAGLVRGELTQNSAKNALIDLGKFGFRNDMSACNRPGVVRVHDRTSVNVPSRSRTAGDTHGHVEILGLDGQYHHFTRSTQPITARFGEGRRPLKYCLVKGMIMMMRLLAVLILISASLPSLAQPPSCRDLESVTERLKGKPSEGLLEEAREALQNFDFSGEATPKDADVECYVKFAVWAIRKDPSGDADSYFYNAYLIAPSVFDSAIRKLDGKSRRELMDSIKNTREIYQKGG
ncbi:MAG: hypothetical protein HC902_14570 [Calothrix sp. SM1_5_4]|nr:hypothetical protein [Calothrix sp. SM1_5_4]